MKSLIYFSHASRPMDGPNLAQILDQARVHNASAHISGLLLYQAGYFLQALEGETEAVESLYKKIEQDDRHHHVTKVYDQSVDERSFSDWSMGFHLVTGDDLKQCESYSDVLSDYVVTTEIDLANEMTFTMLSLFKQYVRTELQRKNDAS